MGDLIHKKLTYLPIYLNGYIIRVIRVIRGNIGEKL